MARQAILRAVLERGALPAGVDRELAVDPELTVDIASGVRWYRLLNRHAGADEQLAEDVAAFVTRIR